MKQLPYLQKANTPFRDRDVTKVADIIHDWNGDKINGVGLIGAPLSKSSISHSGACFAPGTIRKALAGYSTYSIEEKVDLAEIVVQELGDIMMHVTNISESQNRVYETLSQLLVKNPDWLPIVLGGDNSITYPSIKGFAQAKGKVGVIQFDAHHDVRNLEDGGPSNGTPFRSLLESKTIEGEHLVQIGIRDFSNSKPYYDYVNKNSVTVYTMKDVRRMSMMQIIQESLKKLKDQVDSVYVSVDMDVVDQAQAPGCPAIGPGGMDAQDLLDAVAFLGEHSVVEGLEIVEIDPTVDFRDMTSRLAAHVILQFLKGKFKKRLI
ncbi:formimidoylglutamase [Halalkalibacter akibai]|uniref:Formimidoylglutamase n=1 Tax=Halalkalibacter akibai (strain ATCC 43226 / DSM 21942 / CIP 109018 / JCM 9157 / 1139) TaxID=1236973 RepID=W4QVQ2_HALA3|nr:formimidoylglutamase [Halalkalibacter akibai]GAE35713.1 formiminoglutamase [Halalkalibacter akibai JCM 9157]